MKASKVKQFFSKVLLLITIYGLLFTELGCDAFVRKFTRKPKEAELPYEEMVLAPEEYKSIPVPKEELYRQYYLFWKSWQDELINSLAEGANHKKQVDCIEQAIKNLQQLREMLSQAKQKKLDICLEKLINLKKGIVQDLYGRDIFANRLSSERIKREIMRDFSYPKIKNNLR